MLADFISYNFFVISLTLLICLVNMVILLVLGGGNDGASRT